MRRINLSGKKFGRLVAIEWLPREARWLCRCDCGSVKKIKSQHLRKNRVVSCGCYAREATARRNFRRGWAKTPEHNCWMRIVSKCTDENDPSYYLYGARGIDVCRRWKENFLDFLADMGPRPKNKTSIDRINNDGDYEPGNCRWSIAREQSNNTRRTIRLAFNGKTQTLRDWAEELGVSRHVLYMRLRKGWSVKRAFTQKITGIGQYERTRNKKEETFGL